VIPALVVLLGCTISPLKEQPVSWLASSLSRGGDETLLYSNNYRQASNALTLTVCVCKVELVSSACLNSGGSNVWTVWAAAAASHGGIISSVGSMAMDGTEG
jgi:hypothetical protein